MKALSASLLGWKLKSYPPKVPSKWCSHSWFNGFLMQLKLTPEWLSWGLLQQSLFCLQRMWMVLPGNILGTTGPWQACLAICNSLPGRTFPWPLISVPGLIIVQSFPTSELWKGSANIFSPPRMRVSSSSLMFPRALRAMLMQILLVVGPLATALSLRLCCPGLATLFLMLAFPSTESVSFRQILRSALLRLSILPCLRQWGKYCHFLISCPSWKGFCLHRRTSPSFSAQCRNTTGAALRLLRVPSQVYSKDKAHHFRQFVLDKNVRIKPIDTLEQNADIFTIPFADTKFVYLRKKVCG